MVQIMKVVGEERDSLGKASTRDLRARGMVPAVIYGLGKTNVSIALNHKELNSMIHTKGYMTHLFEFEIGKKKIKVIPKDLQLHPVTDNVLHADFMFVDSKSKVKVLVPIQFTNKEKSLGMKQGGVLNVIMHQVELMCKPDAIPEFVECNLEGYVIGQSAHINDLSMTKDVSAVSTKNITIATIAGRVKEESTEEEVEEETKS